MSISFANNNNNYVLLSFYTLFCLNFTEHIQFFFITHNGHFWEHINDVCITCGEHITGNVLLHLCFSLHFNENSKIYILSIFRFLTFTFDFFFSHNSLGHVGADDQLQNLDREKNHKRNVRVLKNSKVRERWYKWNNLNDIVTLVRKN